MASSLQVHLLMQMVADLAPTTPHAGAVLERIRNNANATDGSRWTQGTGSGQVDQLYVVQGSLGAGATNSYNTLAAGALEDIYGAAVDLDELKGMILVPLSGAIRLEAPAANFIGLFDDASDLLNVPAGGMALDWGAAGLDVTTNSKFDITEDTGAATATYLLAFWGAS